MGKHARRRTDPYTPPSFGDGATSQEVGIFDSNVSQHVVAAADKRLYGVYPYDNDPGSKPAIDPRTGNRRQQ